MEYHQESPTEQQRREHRGFGPEERKRAIHDSVVAGNVDNAWLIAMRTEAPEQPQWLRYIYDCFMKEKNYFAAARFAQQTIAVSHDEARRGVEPRRHDFTEQDIIHAATLAYQEALKNPESTVMPDEDAETATKTDAELIKEYFNL